MNNFREVNENDILTDWLEIRRETIFSLLNTNDRKHIIAFDEICESILKSVPKQNRKYIQKQLNKLDESYMDYILYWEEKYYRNGFCDGMQLICGCLK